ncbi:MAG: hypothetical protein Q4D57_06245 [Clostridia bacterium]|nr:hypothetical protein [Clostridia bacterium]
MNIFAQELDKIILKKMISNNKAAKESGIDSSLLRRYRKGERIPRSNEIIDKLQLGLHLTEEEKEQLETALWSLKNPNHLAKEKNAEFNKTMENRFHEHNYALPDFATVYRCDHCDFEPDSTKKMYPINSAEDLERYLCYINEHLKRYQEELFTISNVQEDYISKRKLKIYLLPSIKNATHLSFMNNVTRQHKENIYEASGIMVEA